MSIALKHNTFIKAYNEINISHKKYKVYLHSSELTQTEKNLLKALLFLKKEEIQDALELLKRTNPTNDFLKAYKNYFLGLAYNHTGKYEISAKYLVKSILTFIKIKEPTHQYRPISIISMVYFNLKDTKRLKKYYKVYTAIKEDNDKHNILDYNYRIFINILDKKNIDAIELINEVISKHKNQIIQNLRFYYTLKFMAFINNEDYDSCYDVSESYKSATGFKVKANYKYMVTLLNYMTKDSSIYAYKRDFKDNDYLWLQLKVVQCLNLNNIEEAESYWLKLKENNDELYEDKFKYNGEMDIFHRSLTKALKSIKLDSEKLDFSEEILASLKSNSDKLYYILNHYDNFITKDQLIALIWQEQWSPKNDGRLRTLISRLQKKHEIKIDSVDGKYKISA